MFELDIYIQRIIKIKQLLRLVCTKQKPQHFVAAGLQDLKNDVTKC